MASKESEDGVRTSQSREGPQGNTSEASMAHKRLQGEVRPKAEHQRPQGQTRRVTPPRSLGASRTASQLIAGTPDPQSPRKRPRPSSWLQGLRVTGFAYAHPQSMGKHIHRLSNIDREQKTATCEACGPVTVYLQPSRGTWICMVAKIAMSQTLTSREARKRSIKAWRKTPKGIACIAKAKNKSRAKTNKAKKLKRLVAAFGALSSEEMEAVLNEVVRLDNLKKKAL